MEGGGVCSFSRMAVLRSCRGGVLVRKENNSRYCSRVLVLIGLEGLYNRSPRWRIRLSSSLV